MTIKHLLCDWDETLAHTLSTTKNAYDKVFDLFNMPHKEPSEIKKLTGGKPKSEIFGYMLCGESFANGEPYTLQTKDGPKLCSQEEMQKIIKDAHHTFYDYIEKNHITDASIIEGATTLLSYCRNNGVKLHIISSKSPEYLKDEVKHLGLEIFFDKIYGSPKINPNEDISQLKTREKPNLGTFIAMFDGNPPPADECLVIGDGSADQKLADNIGCKCIRVDASKADGIKKLTQAIGIIDSKNENKLGIPITNLLCSLLNNKAK